MVGSGIVYLGLITGVLGTIAVVKPIPRFGFRKRIHGLIALIAGMLIVATGFILPAPESHVQRAESRLDEFAPVWQFNEVHRIHIAAPPERVFEATKQSRAGEIRSFQTLMWIRRGGRSLPESVAQALAREPLLDVLTRGGFIYLADDPPRELVIGTVIMVPPGTHGTLTPQVFQKRLRPGFVLAVMNFAVRPDGSGGSELATETRVFANSAPVRRRFAAYWRVIYPGSAFIRIMWLRAIERRAAHVSPTGAASSRFEDRDRIRGMIAS
jgi:hypothetical protein